LNPFKIQNPKSKIPRRAGVFDSGAGGLTVVRSLLEHRLFDEIVYYGDTARVPYGTKDANTIIRYGLEAVEFFNNFDVDLLITACNTVSAHALGEMRSKSAYPVYGVIEPGILALERALPDREARILIIATRATIASGRYQRELEALGYRNVTARQTGMLVPIVEEGIEGGPVLEAMLAHYFGDLEIAPDAVILGCTHFPLIADAIREYFGGKPMMIHSGEAIVEHLETEGIRGGERRNELKIFASDNVEGLRAIAARWLDDGF
jgi:glutamate racemase